MTDETITENEQAQLRKIIAFQKVALGIILKWKWLFLLLILLLGAVFLNYFRVKSQRSVSRFESSTRLLFRPRKIPKIEILTEQQLLSILDRSSLKRKVAEQVEMSEEEKQCLSKDVVLAQERNPPDLFTLTVASQTENGAVQKANAYAEILVEAYVAYRTTDLENRRTAIAAQRKTLLDQLAAIEDIKREIGIDVGSGYPSDPATRHFVENWINEHHTVPPHTRGSWKPVKDLMTRTRTTTLDDW